MAKEEGVRERVLRGEERRGDGESMTYRVKGLAASAAAGKRAAPSTGVRCSAGTVIGVLLGLKGMGEVPWHVVTTRRCASNTSISCNLAYASSSFPFKTGQF